MLFKGLNWWNKIVLATNYLCMTMLLFSYLAPYIRPSTSIWFAYLGLLFPVWLGINICYILYWALLRKKQFIISFATILLGLLPFSRFFQVTFFEEAIAKQNEIKIMSFNVRVFDLYNWSDNYKTKDKIVQFLKEQDMDIICFQEYYKGVGTHFSLTKTFETELGLAYHEEHFTTTSTDKNGNHNYFGSAIFSKYPIIAKGFTNFENDNTNHYTFVDVIKNKDTIRIYNAHLGSLKLQNKDYKLIGGDDNKRRSHEKQYKQEIFNRISSAYVRRETQITLLAASIKESPHPSILCTDMNDTPNSYAYNTIAKHLSDAFVKSGNGIGSTYIGKNTFNKILPINRIDYIFYSKAFTTNSFETHQNDLSDHRAISCKIGLK